MPDAVLVNKKSVPRFTLTLLSLCEKGTCTRSTMQKISVVLTANLSNVKYVTTTKH